MAESAPLLHDVGVARDDPASEQFGLTPVTGPKNHIAHTRAVKTLRVVTLVLSAIILGLLITNIIFIDNAFFTYSWGPRRATVVFLKWMIPIHIASIINVIVRVPVLINVMPDTTFATWIIICLVSFIDEVGLNKQWCRGSTWNPEPPHPRCMDQRLTVTIIMGIASALGIILATSYIILLCLRAWDILRSKFWKKCTLSLPKGGVTWSINLNVIRDRDETSIGISAGSKRIQKGQGPVHL